MIPFQKAWFQIGNNQSSAMGVDVALSVEESMDVRACFINRSDSPPGLKPGRLRASNAVLKACSSTQEFGTVFMKHALAIASST